MKTFIVVFLALVSNFCFAQELYINASIGASNTGPTETIGVGFAVAPDILVEADFRNFGNFDQTVTPLLADPSFNPKTGKCATDPCIRKFGTAHNSAQGVSLSALLKSSDDDKNFMYIRPGVLYNENSYTANYTDGTSDSKNSTAANPFIGFGINRGDLSFEITGYSSVYYYSRSVISISVGYKFY
jgi:hypothetical protein